MTVSGYMLDNRGVGSLVAAILEQVEDPKETAVTFFGKNKIIKLDSPKLQSKYRDQIKLQISSVIAHGKKFK